MTGMEFLKNPITSVRDVAEVVSKPCPPTMPLECDRVDCLVCWTAWLATGEPPKEKEPSCEQKAPSGIYSNLNEYLRSEKLLHQELNQAHERSSHELRHRFGNAH